MIYPKWIFSLETTGNHIALLVVWSEFCYGLQSDNMLASRDIVRSFYSVVSMRGFLAVKVVQAMWFSGPGLSLDPQLRFLANCSGSTH